MAGARMQGHLRIPGGRAGRGAAAIIASVALVVGLGLLRPGPIAEREVAPNGAQSSRSTGWTPSYAGDVAPILARACVRCHGPERADKGLRLDSYQRMLAGDSLGTVVIPGGSSLSAIVSVVRYGTMPHDAMKLTPTEIETISRWIDAGSPEN